MAHTYTLLYYHLVFGTKYRLPWLAEPVQDALWPYLGGIAKAHDVIPLAVGGHVDHAHMLVRCKPTHAISRLMQVLKGGSSWWLHETYPDLAGFEWQDGYAAFTVNERGVERVRRYIANQREHHRRKTFAEEYVKFLEDNKIEYDPRYVLG